MLVDTRLCFVSLTSRSRSHYNNERLVRSFFTECQCIITAFLSSIANTLLLDKDKMAVYISGLPSSRSPYSLFNSCGGADCISAKTHASMLGINFVGWWCWISNLSQSLFFSQKLFFSSSSFVTSPSLISSRSHQTKQHQHQTGPVSCSQWSQPHWWNGWSRSVSQPSYLDHLSWKQKFPIELSLSQLDVVQCHQVKLQVAMKTSVTGCCQR